MRRVSGSSPLSSTTGFSRNFFREISFLIDRNGRLAQLVEHALDVRRVSGSSPLSSTTGFSRNFFREISFLIDRNGRLAQLVEHALDVRRVSGSSPLSSTIRINPNFFPGKEFGFLFLSLDLFRNRINRCLTGSPNGIYANVCVGNGFIRSERFMNHLGSMNRKTTNFA